MVKTSQSIARLAPMFVMLLGFVSNSGAAHSRWRGAQDGNAPQQSTPAQTTDKTAAEVKAREILKELLILARKRAEEYNVAFRDLATEERRTSIVFKKNGEEAERREVICEFVVYQSRIDPTFGFEYRNAKSVNGKPLSGQEKRLMKLFEGLAKAGTTYEERRLINRESFSHDKLEFSFYGTAIYQWRELMEYARDSVEITYAGPEKIDGRETIALDFQQTARNERLAWSAPVRLRWDVLAQNIFDVEQRVRGRLWLDARTARICRAERELRLITPNSPDPALLWRQTFEYAQSDLGILVPKRFIYDLFFDFRRSNEGKVESFRTGRLISEFGTFRRFTVSSSEEEKKTIIKDKPQSNDKKPEI
jgi:hypothetical protein